MSEYSQKLIEYEKWLEKSNFKEFFQIRSLLHDAEISFSIKGSDLIMHFLTYGEEELGTCTFIDGSIIAVNKISGNGHISRFHKALKNITYGYEEIYAICDYNYLSIIVFYKNLTNICTGISGPLITIKFKNLIVERD